MIPRLVQRLYKLPQGEAIGASLLLTAILVLFFWRAIFSGESLLPNDLIYELDPVWRNHAPAGFVSPGNRLQSDIVYFFYPWQVEMQRAVSEHRMPLWTPRINNGQPMLGNGQTGMWDPFWVIARLFPVHQSFLVAAILKLWLSGLFTFLLARRLGIGRRGAILAMVTFTFSGPMIVWLGFTVSGVAAWLPLLLYLSERALVKRTTAPFLAVGIVLAFQFFSGHPETSFHVMLTWAVFCLARTAVREGWQVRPFIRLLGRMTLAALIGLALSAVQLLPLVEGILNSAILLKRQARVPPPLLQTALLDWHQWPTVVTTLLPQFFGTPIDNSYWYPYQNYNEQTFYAGIVPLALGLVAMLAWWHGRCNRKEPGDTPDGATGFSPGLWIGLALLTLGIAAQLPVLNTINLAPVFHLVNNGRLRIVYVLGLAMLAGYGLDLLAQNSPRFSAPKNFLIVLCTLAAISLILTGSAYAGITRLRSQFIAMGQRIAREMKVIDHPMFPYSLDYYYDKVNQRYTQAQRLYTPQTPEMFFPVGIALLAGLLEWSRRRGWNRAVWLNGLVVLTCVDLAALGIRLNPTLPQAQNFPPTKAIAFLQQQRGVFRVGGLYLALMPNSSMVFGLSDVRGFDDVIPWRQAKLLRHIPGAFQLNYYLILRSADSPLLDLMNVEYMVSDRELGGRWELAFAEPDSPIRVYRNIRAMPRAFVVYQSEHAANAEAALDRLLDETFDFRARVILEESPPDLPRASMTPQVDQARLVKYEAEQVVVETDTPSNGILVLTDTYTPGWQASIDDQRAHVYVADHAFRAVHVPSGRHRVKFIYAPESFTVGAAISLTTLVLCAAWITVITYRKAQ